MRAKTFRVVTFRVEATVPDRAWELYHDSREYQHAVIEATEGNISAGSNAYSDAVEWAEFDTEGEAKACAKKLDVVIKRFDDMARAYDQDVAQVAREEQWLRPCRSPYCECQPGQCGHLGFYDAWGKS